MARSQSLRQAKHDAKKYREEIRQCVSVQSDRLILRAHVAGTAAAQVGCVVAAVAWSRWFLHARKPMAWKEDLKRFSKAAIESTTAIVGKDLEVQTEKQKSGIQFFSNLLPASSLLVALGMQSCGQSFRFWKQMAAIVDRPGGKNVAEKVSDILSIVLPSQRSWLQTNKRQGQLLHDSLLITRPALTHLNLAHATANMILMICLGQGMLRKCGVVGSMFIGCMSIAWGGLLSYLFTTRELCGASSLVFGLLGARMVVLTDTKSIKDMWTSLFLLVLGMSVPQLDTWCHLGGFVGGYLAGTMWAIGGKLAFPSSSALNR